MSKTFKDYVTRQIAAIKDMLFSLREVTLEYDNAEELKKLLFESINALVDFEIIFLKELIQNGTLER